MRTLLRILLAVVVIVSVVGLAGAAYGAVTIRRPWPQTDGTVQLDGLEGKATVIRDSWGIPHIYAATPHDLFLAQGYVHAQDRFWQMEFSRRIGAGRLAEILGESALGSDRFIRTVGWHRTAAREVELLDAESRAALEAYAAGVNAYVSTHRGRLGLEFTILGLTGVDFEPEPWTVLNTLTWAKVMSWDLGGNMSSELLRAQIADKLGTGAIDVLMPPYDEDHPVIVPHPLSQATLDAVPDAAAMIHPLGTGAGLGSNNWVIAGSRTATGMPLLANDPHLGIQMPSIWYEIGLHCEPVGPDCPFNVVGSSFPGAPGVIIGHNDRIAWGVTNLNPDVQDLFIERINPENPNQYAFQGEWHDMEIVREVIEVAGRDEPVVVDVRITRHGPIINDVAGGTDEEWAFGWQPLALSWTALEPGTLIRSILLLDQAQNWEDFRHAVSYWDAPSQNIVYADVEGNIGYQAPGRIPIRAAGDGTMPVPGWSGEYDWVDTIPYDALPRSFNPDEGYVVTANNAVVGPDFPYLLTHDWSEGYRAQRIVELIEGTESITGADIEAFHGDSAVLYAEEILPHLLALSSEDPQLSRALDLLRQWDGQARRDSAGATLFTAFHLQLADHVFADELGPQLMEQARGTAMFALPELLANGDPAWFDNVNTMERETRDEVLLAALADAVAELSGRLGDDMTRWHWGDLHTATFENQSLGQSGIGPVERLFNRGPVATDGTMAAVNATSFSPRSPYALTALPSYRHIIDLADLTRSVSMHTTGQSGHPFHPHYDDMIDPWRNIDYHPMLWQRQDVEADAEETLILEAQ
jgi:penicillin amidase